MKILIVHNFYQQPGGEDGVFAEECRLLESRGHDVARFTLHNDAVPQTGKIELAKKTIWNRQAADALRTKIREHGSQVVHFHNTFMLISPAAYSAARAERCAVVQTLHNYRLLCPAATFYRDGRVCEDCLHKAVPWPSVIHKCYRNSAAVSGVVAAMLVTHRVRGTYRHDIDRYIALTDFARDKYIEGGLPAEKIVVKPNFVDPDPGPGKGAGDEALFVGRLTDEKGVKTLVQAWKYLRANTALKLSIAGDGPLRAEVENMAAGCDTIALLGRRNPAEIYDRMGAARMLIFPSQWYEGQPRTIVESFAKGTPVVASRLGSMSGMIRDGQTGVLFRAGDARDLADTVAALDADPPRLAAMRLAARAEYETLFSAETNYRALMDIYDSALAERHAGGVPTSVKPGVADV